MASPSTAKSTPGGSREMKLTRSVAYAVGILLQIQDAKRRTPVTAAQIARDCKFPPRFLYRVLRRLVDAGLLEGTSGPAGGYALAKAPADISLLEIVEAVDAPPEGTGFGTGAGQASPANRRGQTDLPQ